MVERSVYVRLCSRSITCYAQKKIVHDGHRNFLLKKESERLIEIRREKANKKKTNKQTSKQQWAQHDDGDRCERPHKSLCVVEFPYQHHLIQIKRKKNYNHNNKWKQKKATMMTTTTKTKKKRNCALFHLLWDTLKKRAVYSLFFLLLFLFFFLKFIRCQWVFVFQWMDSRFMCLRAQLTAVLYGMYTVVILAVAVSKAAILTWSVYGQCV